MLDNGVISNENWTIVDAKDDFSWALFFYAGVFGKYMSVWRGPLLDPVRFLSAHEMPVWRVALWRPMHPVEQVAICFALARRTQGLVGDMHWRLTGSSTALGRLSMALCL